MPSEKVIWGCKDGDKEKHAYVPNGNETKPICEQFGSSVLLIHSGGSKKKCKHCIATLGNE